MEYLILALLILLSAFFSASETAFSCLSRIRIKSYEADGDKKAKKTLKIAENFEKALTAILIGNNIVNIASATIGTIIFTKLLGGKIGEGAAAAVSTLVLTVTVLIFGELLPKTAAKRRPEKIALAFTGPLSVIIVFLTPMVWVFDGIKNIIIKLFHSDSEEPTITEQELLAMIDEIEDEGVLEETESDLVRSALEFDEITVNEIIVPRVDVVAVDIETSVEEIKEIFIKERYSRLPVYRDSIDNIVGVLNEKDFFKFYVQNKDRKLKSIIKDTVFVKSDQLISNVFRLMQARKQHMAVVSDEFGGTEGIVTLEDILEELVGEIWDESDDVETPLRKVADNIYIVLADLSVRDMLEMLDLPADLLESTYTTVGGWVMELLGRIPRQGDETEYGIFKIRVLKTFEHRVMKIKLELIEEKTEEE